jgi:hypothetical protein
MVGDGCGNRRFGAREHGHTDVQVFSMMDRGFGLRSMILEYTGEIITKGECLARIETMYKFDKVFYYLPFS